MHSNQATQPMPVYEVRPRKVFSTKTRSILSKQFLQLLVG
jgi:hypothetical protein